MCVGLITVFMLCFSFGGEGVQQVASSMACIYNPVNSLYSDNSSIIFTSGMLIEKDSLDFVLPISGAIVSVESNGNIVLIPSNSIMVKSTEGGVVDCVGTTLDGIKYIKIRHSQDVYSVIENVDVVGVKQNDIVKKGQDIATAITGDQIVLRLYHQDNQVTNIKLNQSKIVWQS